MQAYTKLKLAIFTIPFFILFNAINADNRDFHPNTSSIEASMINQYENTDQFTAAEEFLRHEIDYIAGMAEYLSRAPVENLIQNIDYLPNWVKTLYRKEFITLRNIGYKMYMLGKCASLFTFDALNCPEDAQEMQFSILIELLIVGAIHVADASIFQWMSKTAFKETLKKILDRRLRLLHLD